ncbi:hypothetical protein BGZ98_005011, partial [Dissophora globulifera]
RFTVSIRINSIDDKSPEAYFRALEMNEKPSAHRRYIRLLESGNNLSDLDRKTPVENFEWWKINKGQQFWLDRQTHLSTMITTGALVEAAEPYAEQSFHRNASWNESSQQQLYLSEASTIHNPKADKRVRDEFKLARAMRDSWVSQVRSSCRETVPRRGIAVFGSTSSKDETKLWRLNFIGVFRLIQYAVRCISCAIEEERVRY